LLKTKVSVKEGRLEEFWFGGRWREGGREGGGSQRKEGKKEGRICLLNTYLQKHKEGNCCHLVLL
jgi:hypothetical protein